MAAVFCVQFRSDQQGLSSDLVVLGFPFDALEFIGRQGEPSVFPVNVGHLFGYLGLQWVSGEAVAKSFQNGGCRLPILELDQGSCAIVFGVRPDFRGRCHTAHPQEVIRRKPIILGVFGLLTLLVNRCCEIIDQAAARLVIFGQQFQHLKVGGFGLAVAYQLIRRMADDQPGRTDDLNLGVGKCIGQLACSSQCLFKLLHGVKIICGRPEDDGRLLMLREGVGKFQRTADDLLLDRIFVLRRDDMQVLPVCVDRRVAGLGGFFVQRITVGGLLEFHGRFAERAVFHQQIRQLVVDVRRFLLRRKRAQKFPVPVQCLLEMSRLVLDLARFLVAGVIMIGKVHQVGFQMPQDVGTGTGFEILPVFGLQTVSRGE